MEKIERISDTEVFIDGMKYIRDTFKSPQPKIKDGDWVCRINSNIHGIGRVINISEDKVILSITNGKSDHTWSCSWCWRLATPQEIEQHLIEICEEKYKGKRVKCLCCNGDRVARGIPVYDSANDELLYDDKVSIYRLGKFAEIVPEKKKLPKTKKEFIPFLAEYFRYERSTTEFLNDYEDT